MTSRPIAPAVLAPRPVVGSFTSTDDVLTWLSGFGGRPHEPSVELVREALAFLRSEIDAARSHSARAQRALDEERKRGRQLAASVLADCESREAEGRGGMNVWPVDLRAALAAWEAP